MVKMMRFFLPLLYFILIAAGTVSGFMTTFAVTRLKLHGRSFSRFVNLRMSSCLVFEAGRGARAEEDSGCITLGSAMGWPCYWSPYLVAGYRFVNATMEIDCRDKERILRNLVMIQTIVENECLPDRFETDYRKILAWRPPSSEFLTSAKPALKAAHLTILIDFYNKFFGSIWGPTHKPARFTNAFLCRMNKMIEVLHPYLAREEEDVEGTPFEQVGYALADERFDQLRDYCEEASKNKKLTAQIYM